MKEYVEREATLKAFEPQCGDWSECWSAEEIKPKLEAIPAADVVEVIHAHWVKPTKIGWRSIDVPHCSHCKEIPCGVDMNTHYCPNCGAKMDGGINE